MTTTTSSSRSRRGKLSAILFGGMTPPSMVSDFGLTVLRVFAGLTMALAHGYGKVPVSDRFVDGVEAMGFPLPAVFAWAAALSEFAGGLLIAAGLLTRPAALFLTGTMFVAAFVRHGEDPFKSKELALLYGCVAVAFLFTGAGRFSVDFLLRGRR